ncbi:MAG: histidine phosphatase family protein [Lachnospiraceae bacterium]|jgi:broad specificity phosphatase PhoE
MRRIFLIRHGLPDYGPYENAMIGVTDLNLSARGRWEMRKTAEWLKGNFKIGAAGKAGKRENRGTRNLRIITSPLLRARQSTEELADELMSDPADTAVSGAFQEISLGTWDGVSRDRIRQMFPEEYERRGGQPGTYRTPGGETFEEVRGRAMRELNRLAEEAEDDIIIVTHAGVIRSLLCGIAGLNLNRLFEWPCPTAGVTEIEKSDLWKIDFAGVRPVSLLDSQELTKLYRRCQTPEPVIAHMRAVRDRCEEIVERRSAAFSTEEKETLYAAALTHDLLRTQPEHAEKGARFLRMAGYPAVADLVREHHTEEPAAQGEVTLLEILCYADETTAGTKPVTIQERFEKSRDKCKTPDAMRHHDNRYRRALGIEKKINGVR